MHGRKTENPTPESKNSSDAKKKVCCVSGGDGGRV